jgi:hypothetical protein
MLTNHGGRFQKFEIQILAGIWSNTWWAKIGENRFHCEHHCSPSLEPCSHAWSASLVEPSPLCPDPSREKWRRRRRTRPGPPSLLPLLSARRWPLRPRQSWPTAPRRRDQAPPAREQGRPARCRSTHVARAPAPASYWTPSPPTPWPIKTPADQTNEHTPLTATYQTHSPLPARPRSTSPASPVRYWTRKAPPRSASVEQADAENWWRSLAGVFSARRRRVLLPLHRAPPSNTRHCNAGELPP